MFFLSFLLSIGEFIIKGNVCHHFGIQSHGHNSLGICVRVCVHDVDLNYHILQLVLLKTEIIIIIPVFFFFRASTNVLSLAPGMPGPIGWHIKCVLYFCWCFNLVVAFEQRIFIHETSDVSNDERPNRTFVFFPLQYDCGSFDVAQGKPYIQHFNFIII